MILTCSACQTTYFAEPSTIGPDGRQVKCASCGHTWFVDAAGEVAKPRVTTSAAHTAYLRTVHERQVKRSRFAAIGAWAGVGVVAVSALGLAVVNRNAVVDTWPRAASAYALVGLEVNRFGVTFENVERRRELVGTVPVLTVAADVRNPGKRAQAAPVVRIGLRDTFGREIAVHGAEVYPAEIGPGEAGRFEAVIENPPADSYTLDLSFVPRVNAADAPRDQADSTTALEEGAGKP